jgi:hypothetical protein
MAASKNLDKHPLAWPELPDLISCISIFNAARALDLYQSVV